MQKLLPFIVFFHLFLFGLGHISQCQPPSVEKIDQSRIHFREGVKYGMENNFEKALQEFQSAIELNPIYAEAFLYKGLTEIELERYEEAIKNLTITIELDPFFSDQAHYFRGIAKYFLHRYSEAIDDFSIAIRMNPDHVAFFQRGKANLNLNEFERALQDFEISVRLKPDFWEAILYRGIAMYHVGEYDQAKENFELAKKNLPNNAKAYYYSGLLNSKTNNDLAAVTDFNRAIELNPDNHQAYIQRAEVNKNLGRNDEANQDYALASELKGDTLNKSDENPEHFVNTQNTNDTEITKTNSNESTDLDFKSLFAQSPHDSENQITTSQKDSIINQISSETYDSKKTNKPGDLAINHSDSNKKNYELPEPVSQELNSGTMSSQSHDTRSTKMLPDVELVNMDYGIYTSDLSDAKVSGFGVQVASYSNTDNLADLVDAYAVKYEKPVFINIANLNGRKLFKLIIGQFDERAGAEAFRNDLRKGNFPDSFLVVFDNL